MLHDRLTDEVTERHFKAIVNATGPWVASLLDTLTETPAPHKIRMVQGSHIIVPRIHQGEQAFLLQHHDGRIVFVIPYQRDFTLIGTTEQDFDGDLDQVKISAAEINYLISIFNLYFKNPIAPADIVHTFSGVRPLIDEALSMICC